MASEHNSSDADDFVAELTFKNSVNVLGAYTYRFWIKKMKPTKRGDLDVALYEKTDDYQRSVKRKLSAYHRHIQIGLIAQGLLQYLSCTHSQLIWQSLSSDIHVLWASPLAALAEILFQTIFPVLGCRLFVVIFRHRRW